MELLKKFLKYLLQPWSTIVHFRIGSIAKATIVGCTVSLTLLALGWTLFSSPVEESVSGHRSVFSILVRPDYRTIKAQSGRQSAVGECTYIGRGEPPGNSSLGQYNLLPGQYCLGWKMGADCRTYPITAIQRGCVWTAIKTEYESGVPARSVGSSRITALEHVKDVWVGAVGSLVGSLLPPAVVLLITQLGVLVGYQYFQRRSKTGIDGKDFS